MKNINTLLMLINIIALIVATMYFYQSQKPLNIYFTIGVVSICFTMFIKILETGGKK